jgi:glutaconate CoA-transferase, subunit B
VRLPGSGGACEIAINARQTLVIMRLRRRAFVQKLDFRTSPGHMPAGETAAVAGQGPRGVITDKALFDFSGPEKEMTLIEVAPGESVASIRAEVSWELKVAPNVGTMTPPSPEELAIVRHELDPNGLYRG